MVGRALALIATEGYEGGTARACRGLVLAGGVVSELSTVGAGLPPISFAVHEHRTGSMAGAREDFEKMIVGLARATMPGVRMIAANPGDWGIDAFGGDLGGAITVWQSKYFLHATTESHQQQIRKSFDSVLKAADKHGHRVESWILCIPSSMDGPTTRWWDGWKKRKEREHGLVIDLWDETALVERLGTLEADTVRRLYYEPYRSAPAPEADTEARPLEEVDPDKAASLDAALFIRQMREAGHIELDGAKRQFFNADLVAREIAHKGVPAEVRALTSADATLHGVWETRFNECCADDSLRRLHSLVWADVRAEHPNLPKRLRLEVVHAWGLVHRLVDNRKAGWVKHWRDVAATYGTTDSTQAQQAGHTGGEETWT
ncbi:serine/threonine protein kinase (plasmid) [Streptomyces hygroscopicus subsp. jinggangensis 5008]|nr:serine/threonine protein kinase [Streptomyces hygroscopicus subsp. jinggangensis 5008]AGF68466.1 serine/threonine protein kinase [Streptomyces hygroscopicus subsp. jinggangensis TL01]